MQPLTFLTAFFLLLSLLSWLTLAFPSLIGRGEDSKSLPPKRQVGTPSESSSPPEFLKKQFENPSGILAVLLLIGGDIVQKAIAQLSSGDLSPTILTPAVFSFGWVGYAFGALMSAFGDGMLMPSPDIQSIVINVGSHVIKNNESFVLGRLLRDLEIKYGENTNPPKLVIRRFETMPGCAKPARDGIWMSFAPCLVLQFGFAAVPLHRKPRNWSILVITLSGTLLAMATASLPQWRNEKFDCGRNAKDTFIITRGNGHNNVFVIQPKKKRPQGSQIEGQRPKEYEEALNLEHLAVNRAMGRRWTRVLTVTLAFLWIGLLIMVAGIEQDTWWLLAIGAVGMIQNVVAAGFTREPKAHGIPLDLINFTEIARQNLEHPGVMGTLKAAEKVAPGVGLALVDVFFPGPRVLSEEERNYWDNQQKALKEGKTALQNQTKGLGSFPITAQNEARGAGSQTTSTLQPPRGMDDIHGKFEPGLHDQVSDNAFQAGPLAANATLLGNTRHGDIESEFRISARNAPSNAEDVEARLPRPNSAGPPQRNNAHAQSAFDAAFPNGRYEIIPTQSTGRECGFYAIINSMGAQYPAELRQPTLQALQEVFHSQEFIKHTGAFGLNNTDNFTVDQLGAVIHFWADTYYDLNIQLGYLSEGRGPDLVPTPGSDQNGRIILWIHNDNAQDRAEQKGLNAKDVMNHYSGLRCSGTQIDSGQPHSAAISRSQPTSVIQQAVGLVTQFFDLV